MRFLRINVQAEGRVVTSGEMCTSSSLVCLWDWGGRTKVCVKGLGLVEGLVLGMGTGGILQKGIVKLGSLSTGDSVIQPAVHPYRSKAVPISAPTSSLDVGPISPFL